LDSANAVSTAVKSADAVSRRHSLRTAIARTVWGTGGGHCWAAAPYVLLYFPDGPGAAGGGTHVRVAVDNGRATRLVRQPVGHALLFNGFNVEHAAAASSGCRIHVVFVATSEVAAFRSATAACDTVTHLQEDRDVGLRRSNVGAETESLDEANRQWKETYTELNKMQMDLRQALVEASKQGHSQARGFVSATSPATSGPATRQATSGPATRQATSSPATSPATSGPATRQATSSPATSRPTTRQATSQATSSPATTRFFATQLNSACAALRVRAGYMCVCVQRPSRLLWLLQVLYHQSVHLQPTKTLTRKYESTTVRLLPMSVLLRSCVNVVVGAADVTLNQRVPADDHRRATLLVGPSRATTGCVRCNGQWFDRMWMIVGGNVVGPTGGDGATQMDDGGGEPTEMDADG
jgi:hypothetical protein